MISLVRHILEGRAAPSVSPSPTNEDFVAMIEARRSELRKITVRLANQDIDAYEWFDLMEAILLEGHTNASLLGRRLLDSGASPADKDVLLARVVTDGEVDFLKKFADALNDLDERYFDGESFDVEAILDRQTKYLHRMRGTANRALERSAKKSAVVEWHLGSKDHCDDCIYFASGSPYKVGELPVLPGECGTVCLFECDCFVTVDGVSGYAPLEL